MNFPLELTAKQEYSRNMPLFTAETAAEMARKRWDAEREREAQPRILPAPCEPNAPTPIEMEIARTREQIEALNNLIDDCTDPKEQDALTRAKDRQFRIWARLAQIPTDPKPAQARATQRRAIPEPVSIPPEPPKQ